MADQYDLSVGAILNDLERPITHISRSRQYSTLKPECVSNSVRLGVQCITGKNLHIALLIDVISNDVERP